MGTVFSPWWCVFLLEERGGLGEAGRGRSLSACLRGWKTGWFRLCSVRYRSVGLRSSRFWRESYESWLLFGFRERISFNDTFASHLYLHQVQHQSSQDSLVPSFQGLRMCHWWELTPSTHTHRENAFKLQKTFCMENWYASMFYHSVSVAALWSASQCKSRWNLRANHPQQYACSHTCKQTQTNKQPWEQSFVHGLTQHKPRIPWVTANRCHEREWDRQGENNRKAERPWDGVKWRSSVHSPWCHESEGCCRRASFARKGAAPKPSEWWRAAGIKKKNPTKTHISKSYFNYCKLRKGQIMFVWARRPDLSHSLLETKAVRHSVLRGCTRLTTCPPPFRREPWRQRKHHLCMWS